MLNFSVLQSVYAKDKPEYLDNSLLSLKEQTLSPKEIIIVKDGTLPEELETVINTWEQRLPIKAVGYEKNQGLAHALNYGLEFVTSELVARMDSDDICNKNRFEKQVNFFENNPDCYICGSALKEFYIEKNSNVREKLRFYPEQTTKKSESLFKGTPLGHPTVMMKTELLKKCKYNENTSMNEDIDLWFRLIKDGIIIYNIQEPLLNFRITDGTFKRRSIKKAFSEFEIYYNNLFELFGFNPKLILPFFRLFIRFLPSFINKKLYFSNLRTSLFSKKGR